MEIKVVRQVLEWNEDCNDELLRLFKEKNVYVINIMGSPGAGKTSVITKIIEALRDKYNLGVVEADIEGKIDAEKINKMGIPVVQLNTGGACHIEAMSIKAVAPEFDLDKTDVILIENIGNLVCPAEFKIGEDLRIAILSVPEGDDKVEKYPLMFATSNCLVINKYDMVNYFDFNYDKVLNSAKEMNPNLSVFPVSSSTGTGFDEFTAWLDKQISRKI